MIKNYQIATDKHIVETYSRLLERLCSESKAELIESLSKSLKPEKKNKVSNFYKSFGAFVSENLQKKSLPTSGQAENLERKKSNFNGLSA